MDNDKQTQRSKDKFQRRKSSKSPINIKGKIKELQEQMERHHRHKDHHPFGSKRQLTPKQNNLTAQNVDVGRNSAQRKEIYLSGMRSQEKNRFGKSPQLGKKISENVKTGVANNATRPNKLTSPEVKILRMSSDKTGSQKKGSLDNEEEDLNRLKEQNLKFKEIYNRSQQKLQKLEGKLQEMKTEH